MISQRSLGGALRSILHQLLSANLLRLAFPEICSFLQTATTVERVRRLGAWQTSELKTAVIALFASIESERSRRVLLLLDGIDEFGDDADDIFRLLQVIAAHDSVKVCVSSRPRLVFERAFTNQPHLRSQDATCGDMTAYVLAKLADAGPERHEVVRAIVERAEGVFLWATVAVDEINRWELKRRSRPEEVRSLPLGLDSLYRYILVDIASDSDHYRAAKIFKLIIAREDACAFTRDDDTALLTAWDLVLSSAFNDSEALTVGPIVVDEYQATRWCQDQIKSAQKCTRRLLKFALDRHTYFGNRQSRSIIAMSGHGREATRPTVF